MLWEKYKKFHCVFQVSKRFRHTAVNFSVSTNGCHIFRLNYLLKGVFHMYSANKIIEEVKKAIVGKDEILQLVLCSMLAGGHILLEDVPGVGKTTIALAFSRVLGLDYKRIQFTPDVMPSDVTGYTVYKKETNRNVYVPGAAMCNLLLADEINRASSKTQSALLEVMAEGNLTVDGKTMPVPKPFFVIATQNPTGSAGTQPLPESQLDRFLVRLSVGYPDQQDEVEMMKRKSRTQSLDHLNTVMDPATLEQIIQETRKIHVTDEMYYYIASLTEWTRNQPSVQLGVSPRGTLALMDMAKAVALLNNRNYMIPRDVYGSFLPVCAHRIILSSRARINGITEEQVLKKALSSVPAPKMAN